MTSDTVTVEQTAGTEGHAEIVVRPGFYQLDPDDMMNTWDGAVRLAQSRGLFLSAALYPQEDPRHTMHIDTDGTEHHYLLPNESIVLP